MKKEKEEPKKEEPKVSDIDAVLDGLKELVTTVADLAKQFNEVTKQIELSRKAGKF